MDIHDYDPTAVRAARIRAGIATQQEAAARFRVTDKTISRVETGTTASYDLLAEMARAYSVDVRDWLRGTPCEASAK
jgi:transcriptional regulator with XRE-family HTH domain